jgi:hypothetical protein
MPLHPNVRSCAHIKVTGIPCGSPALRNEKFCYFHQRMLRGISTPHQSRVHPVALIESNEAIQSSLMEIINAVVRNTIDLRRADLILKAIHIAVKNSRRVNFELFTDDMVQQAPAFPTPPRPATQPAVVATAIDPTKPKPPQSAPAAAAPKKQAAAAAKK